MEFIEFRYLHNNEGENLEIKSTKTEAGGFGVEDICRIFMDFMESIGYTADEIYREFNG